MCGITGFTDFKYRSGQSLLKKMTDTLQHRGPDDAGYSVFKEDFGTVGLGHRRLSILDLSHAGHQPMKLRHLTITFNGELYNFKEIRKELEKEGFSFTSDSDTEVILKAWLYWGTECLHKFIGMFAFAIYDKEQKVLYLVRDRAGVKPLYYFLNNELLIFGSELKALMAHPGFEKKIDKKSVGTYFQFGYIPSPYSIFENTHKVRPGEFIRFLMKSKEIEEKVYWNAAEYYLKSKKNYTYQEAREQLEPLLKSAFDYRMVSDVPVGVFLSGGYDSTAVTAFLQQDRTEKIKTFTIGFEEGNNETDVARKTARYLGTDHHEMICTEKEAQEFITRIPVHYDEPFADSTAIPTMLVSKFAREHVTVALSADGGDEVFGGYNSYQKIWQYQQKLAYLPAIAKPVLAKALNLAGGVWPGNDYRRKHMVQSLGHSLNGNPNLEGQRLFQWANRRPHSLIDKVLDGYFGEQLTSIDELYEEISPIEAATLTDFKMYLPGDILTKVDRATMSVSLEGREPFLDHRILEFGAQLPMVYKIRPGEGKVILKDIVHDHVPGEWLKRPKTGFSIPMTSWLQGGLREVFDSYVNESSLNQSGIFNVKFVLQEKEKFLNNKMHYTPMMWKILMFQMWWDRWMQ